MTLMPQNLFHRNLSLLQEQEFDVLVVGGGITGAGIAWDAALRGFRTALIDKGDFSSGTSKGCFKIVHGGLRYLQHFDFSRMEKSVKEQRTLLKIAPHFVKPLPFLIPCYGYTKKSREFLNIGVKLYEFLKGRVFVDHSNDLQLPAGYSLSTTEVYQIAPGLEGKGVRGGVIFYDAQMASAERLVLSVAKSAAHAGAVCANYVELQSVRRKGRADSTQFIDQVIVTDRLTGKSFPIRTKQLVSAAGPWNESIDRLVLGDAVTPSSYQSQKFVKGMQFVFPSIVSSHALAVESSYQDGASKIGRGGRSYFLVPWQGHTIVGTFESLNPEHPDSLTFSQAAVETFLQEIASAYRSPFLSKGNLRSAFGGLIPLDESHESTEGQHFVLRDDCISDYSASGVAFCSRGALEKQQATENYLSVRAVKYTTFRALAEKVVDILESKLGGRRRVCATTETLIAGSDFITLPLFRKRTNGLFFDRLPDVAIERLMSLYGSELWSLVDLAEERPELVQEISKETDLLDLLAVYGSQHEMVFHLSDFICRRTLLGAFGAPNRKSLYTIGERFAVQHGWSAEELEEEVSATLLELGRINPGRDVDTISEN